MRKSYCSNCKKMYMDRWVGFCPVCGKTLAVIDDGKPKLSNAGLPLKRDVPWLRGKPLSEEHKAKLRAAHFGRSLTSDHVRHIRESKIGRRRSHATRRKISDTMKRQYRQQQEEGS